MFNGLGMNLGNLSRLSNAKTRSISPENFTGEKGKGGMSTDGPSLKHAERVGLGQGWKISPYIRIKPGETQFFGHYRHGRNPAYLGHLHGRMAF